MNLPIVGIPRRRSARTRRGFSFVEVMVAGALSAGVAIGVVLLMIYSQRILKANFSQRQAISNAKAAAELFFSQLAPAVNSGVQVSAPGNGNIWAAQGWRLDFHWPGEANFTRRIEVLPGDDDDFDTPWDNTLVFDADTGDGIAPIEIAEYISCSDAAGPFSRNGATENIGIRFQVGDPVGATPAIKKQSDGATGPGIQGSEVNISVFPRNS